MRSWFRGCVRSHPPIVNNQESRSGGLSMYDAANAFDARPSVFSSRRVTVAWDASSFSSADARSGPAPMDFANASAAYSAVRECIIRSKVPMAWVIAPEAYKMSPSAPSDESPLSSLLFFDRRRSRRSDCISISPIVIANPNPATMHPAPSDRAISLFRMWPISCANTARNSCGIRRSSNPVVTATTDAFVPAAKAFGSSEGMM